MRTAMSMRTAISLSLQNLLTKKGRTIITAFAGSIGIIGVALVLALTNGLTGYMNDIQTDTLSGYPITISSGSDTLSGMMRSGNDRMALMMGTEEVAVYTEHPDGDVLYSHAEEENDGDAHVNVLSDEYLA